MNTKRLARATTFAIIAHEGDYRKGTQIPYVTHPIEAGLIASSLTRDEDVIIAAILHDVVEDTSFTLEDICQNFGKRVASLVQAESEDKMPHLSPKDSWMMRKQRTIDHLMKASREEKIIALADKLSNIRQSQLTHREKGDDMWQVFHQQDPAKQAWYYRLVGKALEEFQGVEAYEEYMALVEEVFQNY